MMTIHCSLESNFILAPSHISHHALFQHERIHWDGIILWRRWIDVEIETLFKFKNYKHMLWIETDFLTCVSPNQHPIRNWYPRGKFSSSFNFFDCCKYVRLHHVKHSKINSILIFFWWISLASTIPTPTSNLKLINLCIFNAYFFSPLCIFYMYVAESIKLN